MPERGMRDARIGAGGLYQSVEMPTVLIPCNLCTWVVVRPGPGLESISHLKYANALCGFRHEPDARTAIRGIGA